MDVLAIIGVILMVYGFANAAWSAVLYLISLSAVAGTSLSKKVGTSNEHADTYLEEGKGFAKALVKKIVIRLVIGGIGWLFFFIATGHF